MIRQMIFINPIPLNEYEQFVPLYSNPNMYMISNFGRIYNGSRGYFCYTEKRKDERYLWCPEINDYTHIAMMRSFNPIEGCESMSVIHKDGNYYNNYIFNLEWSTEPFNPKTIKNEGFNNYACKVTPEQVEQICQLFSTGNYSGDEIANMVGVGRSVVYKIRQRKVFKEIVSKYTWPDTTTFNRSYKYTDEEIHKLCKYIESHPGLRQCELIKLTGYPKHVIKKIYNRTMRTDISSQYKW